MNYALIKKPGDVFRPALFPTDQAIQLDWLQQQVGGYIQEIRYPVGDNVLLICDEEGKMKGLQPNVCVNGDIIVGKIVLVGVDGDGNMLPLTPEQVDAIKQSIPKATRHEWFIERNPSTRQG